MDIILKSDYVENPCRASSIPYWKAKAIVIPNDMRIIHQDDYAQEKFGQYTDQTYFRLIHYLREIPALILPTGFSVHNASLGDFAAHINQCYDAMCVTENELRGYTQQQVYDSSLWLAIRNDVNGSIVATGIGELDMEVGEGILEWIQVSEAYRRCGLGSYIISELLRRMKGRAEFATVSGQCDNPSNPEALYRRCGFEGSDVWHILRREN